MQPTNAVPVYRPASSVFDRADAANTYQPRREDAVDALRRRLQEEFRRELQEYNIHPNFTREDHIDDNAFERMSPPDVPNLISRRERINAAVVDGLEAMGEGASTDIHTGRRRAIFDDQSNDSESIGEASSTNRYINQRRRGIFDDQSDDSEDLREGSSTNLYINRRRRSMYDDQRYDRSAARHTWLQPNRASSFHPATPPLRSPSSGSRRGDDHQRVPPALRRPNRGMSVETSPRPFGGMAARFGFETGRNAR